MGVWIFVHTFMDFYPYPKTHVNLNIMLFLVFYVVYIYSHSLIYGSLSYFRSINERKDL